MAFPRVPQTQFYDFDGNPNGVLDGPTSQVIKDPGTGDLYIKQSEKGDKNGWRKISGDGSISVFDFGVDPTGVIPSGTQLQAAIAFASASSRPLVIPPGTYNGGLTFLILGNIPSVIAFGANLIDVKVIMNGTNQHWYGGKFSLGSAGAGDVNEVISQTGTNTSITYFDIANDTATSTAAYTGVEFSGTNGAASHFNLNMGNRSAMTISYGSGTRISHGYSRGGDDGFVIKATLAASTDIDISHVTCERHSDVLSFGTQVAFPIRGVTASNLIAKSCTIGVWFKPGNAGYPGGSVEDVNITNLVVDDPTGIANQMPIEFDGKLGMTIKRVNFTNVTANVRRAGVGTRGNFVDFFLDDCDVSDITFTNCQFRDANGGAVSGSANQMAYGIVLECANGASITNVKFNNVLIDGTGGQGYNEAGSIAPSGIELNDCHFRNNNNGTGASVILAISPIKIKDITIETALTGSPFEFAAGVRPIGERQQVRIRDINAGSDTSIGLWAPTRKAWVHSFFITPRLTVGAHDTNYTTYRFYNNDTASDIKLVTSKLTGGISLLAMIMNPVSANVLTAANTLIDKDRIVTMYKEDSGSGQAITEGLITIDYIPYGII